ncbi:flippase [Leptolyngbya sp. DQ-M1]|uniref:flippase n=1 Tax=Leptolyngbya sp. DQ-M1 TaxID=2933920 RepID=UPI00329995F1
MNQSWVQLLPPFLRTKLEGRYTVQKILGNTGWLLVDRILRMGLALIVGVWVARYLGPEQFGLFNYAIAFSALFSPIATLGLEGLVVRDIVQSPADKDEILGTTFLIRLVGGISAWLLSLGVIYWMRPNDAMIQWLVGITAAGFIFQSFDIIDSWFQSQLQSKYSILAKSAAFIFTVGVRVTLIHVRAPLIAFAWVACFEGILIAIGLIAAYCSRGFSLTSWRGNITRARTLLKNCWALILSGLAIMTYMKIDQVMLNEMMGSEAVGVYSAAVKLSEIWYFVPMALTSSAFPAIVELRSKDIDLYYQRLQSLFNFLVRLAYAIALPVTFLAGWLIMLLFGSDYAASAPILAIHIWAGVFVFLGVAQESWSFAEGFLKLSLQRTLIGAVINVLLNFILIPIYAGVGAAIATVIAYGCAVVVTNFVDPRAKRILALQLKALFLVG